MRILAVGDTHGDEEWVADVVIPTAQEYECPTIMQLGDFMFVWDQTAAVAVDTLNRLSVRLQQARTRLVFLPGNHENHRMLGWLCRRRPRVAPEMFWQLAPHVFYTGRVAGWLWNGRAIMAVGGATSIDKDDRIPGVSWWPEEQLSPEEAEVAKKLGKKLHRLRGRVNAAEARALRQSGIRLPARRARLDVLFSHDGPTNVPFALIPDLESEIHRQRMSDVARVVKPIFWYHGHYHEFAEYNFPLFGDSVAVTALSCNNRPLTHTMAVICLDEEEAA